MALSDEIPCLVQHFYSAYMDPDVTRPLLKENMVKAYTHYKKYLQLLSWQVGEDKDKDKNPPRKWMLKCPVHLFYPKEIATAFPDAKLIWTHRHPISAVPSMCSLLKSFHKLYYEEEGRDDAALGKTLLRVSEDLLTQAPKDIKDCGLPCAHITYNRLLSEPVVVVKEIYAQFGWSFSKEYV